MRKVGLTAQLPTSFRGRGGRVTSGPGLTLPSSFFQYCRHRMTAMTASSSRMMPTRQPIRMAVLLLSTLATGSPGRGVLAAKSGPAQRKVKATVNCREPTDWRTFPGKEKEPSRTCEGPNPWNETDSISIFKKRLKPKWLLNYV